MLIGVGGSGKQSLAKLAVYMAELAPMTIVISKSYSLSDFKADLQVRRLPESASMMWRIDKRAPSRCALSHGTDRLLHVGKYQRALVAVCKLHYYTNLVNFEDYRCDAVWTFSAAPSHTGTRGRSCSRKLG